MTKSAVNRFAMLNKNIVMTVRKIVHAYDQGRSIWIHKMPVSMSIYQFKYKNRRIYGEFYAKEMIRIYGRLIREWEIEVIVPIPLHRRKRDFVDIIRRRL